jgi:hypothetical protein
MTTGTLDRRTMLILAAGVLSILVLRFVVMADKRPAEVVTEHDSVPLAEKRLAKLRETAATVPAKEKVAKQAAAQLATRETGPGAAARNHPPRGQGRRH